MPTHSAAVRSLLAASLAACSIGAQAPWPTTAKPRTYELPLARTTDTVHSLACYDTQGLQEPDVIALVNDEVVMFDNVGGLGFRVPLATGVLRCHPLLGGTSPGVIIQRAAGFEILWRDELVDPSAGIGEIEPVPQPGTIQALALALPNNVVRIQSSHVAGNVHIVAVELDTGVIETYGLVSDPSALSMAIRAQIDPANEGITNVQDWTLANKDDSGTADVVIVGTMNIQGPTVGVAGFAAVAGTPVGAPLALAGGATNAVALATQRGASDELCVVFQDNLGDAHVKAWVDDANLESYTCDWNPHTASTAYTSVYAADIDDEGVASYSDLMFDVPGAGVMLGLMRSGSGAFANNGRRAWNIEPSTPAEPGLGFCADTNNSCALDIQSGADLHLVRMRDTRQVLTVVTGLNIATDNDPSMSQNMLWTTADHMDFLTGVRLNGSSMQIRVELDLGYLLAMGYSQGAQVSLQIRRWDQIIPTSMAPDWPIAYPVESQMTQWDIIDLTAYVAGQPRGIVLPDFDTTIGPYFNAYCEARFVVEGEKSPPHVFGGSADYASGGPWGPLSWNSQLRAVAVGGNAEDEVATNGVGGREGAGVKKPNSFIPVSTASPIPAPNQPHRPGSIVW